MTGELTRGHLLGFLLEVSVVRMIAFGSWRRMMKMKMRMKMSLNWMMVKPPWENHMMVML